MISQFVQRLDEIRLRPTVSTPIGSQRISDLVPIRLRVGLECLMTAAIEYKHEEFV
ncbi:hypothetical protein [Micromonospora chokoriensis]